MGKSLVIVESPAKAKTINKYLGDKFIVKSSVGHIRDIKGTENNDRFNKEKTDQQTLLAGRLGIDPYHDWSAQYGIMQGKEKVVNELKHLAKNADHIYLASDHDREGEAIAWHLRQILGGDDSRYSRVVFNEITKTAIHKAFENPGQIDMGSVNAQQTRRFLDRLVGFIVSPVLMSKITRGLSAGRVQSVAVKLIVEREREIKMFVPEEYWVLDASLSTLKQTFEMQVTTYKGKAFKPITEDEIKGDVAKLKNETFTVVKNETKPTTSRAPAPFTTSTLQQAASSKLGFGVKKTMTMAQRLYEGGHITYMRTDSTNLSQDALAMVRGFIKSRHGDAYLPEKANYFGSKENAQEAHEAIRPSDVNKSKMNLGDMEQDAVRLYELIWSQFVACQMTPALYDSASIVVEAGDYQLRAKGRTIRFDGWTKVTGQGKKTDEDKILPAVSVGDVLRLKELLPTQHFTKPAGRYSDASLVKEMEKRGIGRPSTYASIITTIQDRGYVRAENRRFFANKMGEIVTNRLEQSFGNLMDYNFTAMMESNLDKIVHNEINWKGLLDEFFKDLMDKVTLAKKPYDQGGMRPNMPVYIPLPCSKCNRPMGIRTGTSGVFLGCTGYGLEKADQCKHTVNLIPASVIAAGTDDEAELKALRERKRCVKCGTVMDSYLMDANRKVHICGDSPVCDGVEVEAGTFEIEGYKGPSVECEKCGNPMHVKLGRFGKYVACTNTECKNTRKLLRDGRIAGPRMDPIRLPESRCEKADDYYILRESETGLFMSASTYPKCRESRPPYIDELVPLRDQIPQKYQHVLDAPTHDPEGNRSTLRYSRKTLEVYVSTNSKDGKSTGWSKFFKDGKWQ